MRDVLKADNVDMIAWNVRGLQSSQPGVVQLLSLHTPLALVLTETKLQASHATQPWVRNMHSDYDTFSSCFPQPPPFDSYVAHLPRSGNPNRAGVRCYWRIACGAQILQYLSKHSIPNSLRGFLAHVSLHSPHSRPLYIVGAYCPPMSAPNWGPVVKERPQGDDRNEAMRCQRLYIYQARRGCEAWRQ